MYVITSDNKKILAAFFKALGKKYDYKEICSLNQDYLAIFIGKDNHRVKMNEEEEGSVGHFVTKSGKKRFVHIELMNTFALDLINEAIKKGSVTGVINCCEPSKKGQFNFFALKHHLNANNYLRVWLSQLLDSSVLEAIKHMEDDDHYEHFAVNYLTELTIDIFLERFLYAKQGTGLNTKEVYALNLLYNKEVALLDFNKHNFYKVKGKMESDLVCDILFRDGTERTKNVSFVLDEISKVEEQMFYVTKSTWKERLKAAPPLFNNSDAIKACSKQKIKAEQAIKSLNFLFGQGYITNPETDKRSLPIDLYPKDISDSLNQLKTVSELMPMIHYIDSRTSSTSLGEYMQEGHDVTHGIMPTLHVPDVHLLDTNAATIYLLIAMQYLKVLAGPHIVSSHVIKGVSQSGYQFKGEFIKVIHHGFEAFCIPSVEEAQVLRELEKEPAASHDVLRGDRFSFSEVYLSETSNNRPVKLTIERILKAMDNPAGKAQRKTKEKVRNMAISIGDVDARAKDIDNLFNKGLVMFLSGDDEVYLTEKGRALAASGLASNKSITDVYKIIGFFDEEGFAFDQKIEAASRIITKDTAPRKTAKRINWESLLLELSCPVCSGSLSNTPKKVVCAASHCSFDFSKVICEYRLCEEDIRDLIGKGKTKLLHGFTFKSGAGKKAKLEVRDGKVRFCFD